MGLNFLVPVFGILLVMIPVLGLTIVLTLRFGLKPFLETLALQLQNSGFVAPDALQTRVEELSGEVDELRSELHRLHEAQAFDRRLLESRGEATDQPAEDSH